MKNILIIILTIIITLVGSNYYYGKKVESQRQRIVEVIKTMDDMKIIHNKEIGTYYTKISLLSEDISKESLLNEGLKKTIRRLQSDLDTKINQVSILELKMEDLEKEGTAIATDDSVGNIIYTVKEKEHNVELDLVLKHPSGDYKYTISIDPIEMQLFAGFNKKKEVFINSVDFVNAPTLSVSRWELITDKDPRTWHQKLWDNATAQVGVFAGNTSGITVGVGYDKIMGGFVISKEGANAAFWYKLK